MTAHGVIAPEEIDTELARLDELSLDELKAVYADVAGLPLPKFLRRSFTELVVGHALQSATLGGHDRETRRALDALAGEIVPYGAPKPRPKNRKPRIGTKLLREWQGRMHEVVVVEDGYLWRGTTFSSLTEIARNITGTNWNGWVFFGIKKTPAKRSDAPRRRIAQESAHA